MFSDFPVGKCSAKNTYFKIVSLLIIVYTNTANQSIWLRLKCLINKWTKRFQIFCYSLDIHNMKCQIMVSILLIHLVNKITCFNFNMLADTSIIQSKHENTENFGIQSIRWNRKSPKWFRLVSLRELAFEKSKYSTQSGLTSVVVTDISSAERPFVSMKPLVFVAFSISL